MKNHRLVSKNNKSPDKELSTSTTDKKAAWQAPTLSIMPHQWTLGTVESGGDGMLPMTI